MGIFNKTVVFLYRLWNFLFITILSYLLLCNICMILVSRGGDVEEPHLNSLYV